MKQKLNFTHYTDGSIDTLQLVDCSDYFEKPNNLLYEIKFPSFDKWFTGYGNISSITAFTTKTLEADYCDFPDGLYKIRMSVAPNENVFICKSIMKLDKFHLQMKEIIEKIKCSLEDKDLIEKLYRIDKYIYMAELLEDETVSLNYYNIALKELKKLKDV